MQNNVEIIQINISGEGQTGHDLVAHRDPRTLRRLHPRHRTGQHPPVADARHPDQDHGRQVGKHYEGAVVQGVGTGRDDPFHAHLRGTLQRLGGPSGQKPLHHHPAGPHRHGTPHRRGDEGRGRARAEHRRHQTPHGPHAPLRGRPRRQVVHRALGARIAHRPGTQHDAGGIYEPLGDRSRRLVPEGRHLPPQPPPDLFRHGLDADRDRGDRRTGRAGGRGRQGARNHGQRHARRDRFPRKFRRGSRCSRGWTFRSWRRSPAACRSPRGWSA